MEQLYINTCDYQNGGFAIGRCLTLEHWREQAIEWAEIDEFDGIVEELKELECSEVIDYINEFWTIEIKPISELTKSEILDLRGSEIQYDDYEKIDRYNYYKNLLRNEAINYQYDLSESNLSYGELANYSQYFYERAKRYGLVKEFKENGII